MLCQAAALAAEQEAPNLTLSLVLQAAAEHANKPSVLSLLPTLTSRIDESGHQHRALLEVIGQIASKIDQVAEQSRYPSTHFGYATPSSNTGLNIETQAALDRIEVEVKGSRQDLRQLANHLFVPPQRDAYGELGPPTLKLATAAQLEKLATAAQLELVADHLPNRIVTTLAESPKPDTSVPPTAEVPSAAKAQSPWSFRKVVLG